MNRLCGSHLWHFFITLPSKTNSFFSFLPFITLLNLLLMSFFFALYPSHT
ncbi:hypothetical protein HMPREF1320_2062 [Capnocytophaga sp. oral taxon 335 str. F0486]|nr:hypothetical protein HMPREF1320_2062 [Capnocytophaga sp. oral taxon 335 str. F0486]